MSKVCNETKDNNKLLVSPLLQFKKCIFSIQKVPRKCEIFTEKQTTIGRGPLQSGPLYNLIGHLGLIIFTADYPLDHMISEDQERLTMKS